jgi:hypothetical protein
VKRMVYEILRMVGCSVCFEREEMPCLVLLQASRWPYVLRCDEHFVKEHIVVARETSHGRLACHYSGVLDIAWCEFEAGLGPTRGQDWRVVRGVTCDYSNM